MAGSPSSPPPSSDADGDGPATRPPASDDSGEEAAPPGTAQQRAGDSREDDDLREGAPRERAPAADASRKDELTGNEPASDEPREHDLHEDASRRVVSADRTRQRLLGAVGGLYALAQTLTSTERAARRLVEATYARAAEALAAPGHDAPLGAGHPAPTGEDARAWIFALLVQTAREAPSDDDRFGAEATPGETAADRATEDESDSHHHFQYRAQERFLRRTLPSAFAALAPQQRLLLTLNDVEGLGASETARVAGGTEAEARDQCAHARADLREALRQMAPRPERPFVEDDALPDARLARALRDMAKRDLTAPPPALRPAARHALSRPQEAPSAPHTGTPAPSRPASERADSSPPEAVQDEKGERRRLPRLLVALLLIAVAGGLAYLATTVLDASRSADLATLSAQDASGINLRLRTDRPDRAEQFVRDELGRRLRVPRIEGATLRGVGLAEVAAGERVPVFLFRDDSSGRPVAAYAYDYALLDRAASRLELSNDLRQALQEEGRVATQEVGSQRVLLWRHRDDIFAAVTERADSLKQRIAF